MAQVRRHKLVRFADTKDGVFGRLERWHTVEEENLDNRARVSCIPAGVYRCRRTTYHKGGYETFEITGVPGRTRILFHRANTEEDIEGCVGLGLAMGVMPRTDEDSGQRTHKLAVFSSGEAFKQFMAEFQGVDEWELVVEWYKWSA